MTALPILTHRRSMIGLAVIIGMAVAWISIRLQCDSELHFSKELSDKIEIGMTRTRVIEIVGCPPGDYCTEAYGKFPPTNHHWDDYELWSGDFGDIEVFFDSEEKVVSVAFWQNDPPKRRGWFERALDRVKRLVR